MEALNPKIWILGLFLLTMAQSSKVDDICYEWSGNLGDGFVVGQTDARICATNWKGNGDLVPDMTTCYGYYYCQSQTSVGSWNHCRTGQHFDVFTGKCVSPEASPCVFNRCRNVMTPYLAVVSTGCMKYQLCATGAILTCSAEKPYFDEVIQTCVATQPSYNICQYDMG